MKIKFYPVGLLILVFAVAAQAQTYNLKGNIGTAKFQMTLMRDESGLAGDYFYDKQGSVNKLNLKGSIGAKGNFTLDEFDSGGKKTGVFKGKWTDDDTSVGVWLEGTWQKPGGKETSFSAEQQYIYFTGGLAFNTRKIAENNKLKLYEIDAEYPELSGADNPNAAKFNALAKQEVMKTIAAFKQDMSEQTAEDLKLAKERGSSNYVEIGYSVVYADNNFASLNFSENSYEGGAHPNHQSFTINYDLKNGRELALADLFKPGANYLKVISDYSIAKLKAETGDMSDDDWLKSGAGAEAKNFSSWNINEKGLIINFDPYQVAAYAAGPQTVIIPFEKLKNILKPGGGALTLQK